MLDVKVNTGCPDEDNRGPFIVIDTEWTASGWGCIYWLDVTPKQLRELASKLEEAEHMYQEARKRAWSKRRALLTPTTKSP